MSESPFPLISKFLGEMKGEAKGRRPFVLLLGLLLLAALFLTFGSCAQTSAETDTPLSEESRALEAWRAQEEEKLEELICRLDEVEKCYVSLSYVTGEGSVREGGVTVSYEPPQVGAVVILYQGDGGYALKQKIVDMVTTLYSIGSNRVSVNSV